MKLYKALAIGICTAFLGNLCIEVSAQNRITGNIDTKKLSEIARKARDTQPEPQRYSLDEAEIIYNTGMLKYKKGDEAGALPDLETAADNGVVEAQALAGRIYLDGTEQTKADGSKAYKYLKMAADNRDAMSQALLSKVYRQGKIAPKDNGEAKRLAQESAQQECKEGYTQLGIYYDLVEKDPKSAVTCYLKAVEGEDANPVACYNLAGCYEYGEGVGKDLEEAMFYYERAEELGYEKAKAKITELKPKLEAWRKDNPQTTTNVIGKVQEDGLSQDEIREAGFNAYDNNDLINALNYFTRLDDENKNGEVYFCMGVIYQNGTKGLDDDAPGISPDLLTASEYYNNAFEMGVKEAASLYAQCLIDSGRKKDAYDFLESERVRALDDPDCYDLLASLYGSDLDLKKAQKCKKKADTLRKYGKTDNN